MSLPLLWYNSLTGHRILYLTLFYFTLFWWFYSIVFWHLLLNMRKSGINLILISCYVVCFTPWVAFNISFSCSQVWLLNPFSPSFSVFREERGGFSNCFPRSLDPELGSCIIKWSEFFWWHILIILNCPFLYDVAEAWLILINGVFLVLVSFCF